MLNSHSVEPAQASPLEASLLAASAPLSPVARIAWAVLIIATLAICYFSHLGAIGLVGPDEPRYAWIARDMAETGDWVTPRLYGRPWFEKPPLYYWCAALSFKLFGVGETAARIPSAMAALLATLAIAWLAWRLYGAETARWLLLLLPTSVGMIGFSHAAATDMIFASTLTLALVASVARLGLAPIRQPQSSASITSSISFTSLLFGFFLGLAVLAKGPAAIVLVGGAAFFWAFFTKRWRDAFRLLHPAALATFCLTALPWYILCARRNRDFFRVFIIEHNFKRYLTPEFQHIQPFWFYGVVLLVAFLPWTALFLWSAVSGAAHLWRTRRSGDATLFLLCWSAFCLLFFTISQSKLPGYILPAIPAIALLFARRWRALESVYSKPLSLSVLVAALLLGLGYLFMVLLTRHMRGPDYFAGIAAGWILAALLTANLVLGVGIWLASKGQAGATLAAGAVLPILIAALFANRFVPAFFLWDPSGKTIAQELLKKNIPSADLAVRTMKRGQLYSLSFYLRHEIPEWDREPPREGYLLVGGKSCTLDPSLGLSCEAVPFDLKKTGFFLYRIRPRSVGAPGGREMK
jgi:4-amino-4-deoxy-L-arabinose transferase-like glycosyltransferase